MGRGILSGVFWGGLLAVASLWLVSQLGGVIHLLAPPQQVASDAPQAATGEIAVSEIDAGPALPDSEAAPASDPSRQTVALPSTTPENPPTASHETAAVPVTGEAGAAPAEPQAGTAPEITALTETPIVVEPAQEALAVPVAEAAPDMAEPAPTRAAPQTATAMPEAPEQPSVDPGGRLVTEALPETTPLPLAPSAPAADALPETNAESPAAPAPADAAEPQPVPVSPDAAEVPAAPEPATPEVADSPVLVDPTSPQAPDAPVIAETEAPALAQPPVVAEAAVPEAAEDPVVEPVAPEVETPDVAEAPAVEPAPEESEVAALVPTPQTPDAAEVTEAPQTPRVRINRLPSIGDEPEVEEAAAIPEAEEPSLPDSEPVPSGPAIQAYAAAFENPENRPLLAIVLIDDGGARASLSDLQALPFPVSYVVDASRDDAAAAMADFRAAGQEVVALTPLPDRVQPQDVEVSFQAYLTAMPEVVAVMDTRDAAFQSGRQVATQVAEILAASGHGMITYSRGLNAATQVAQRQGVPARLVFREFDNDGQDGAAIKRFLDQAAFRAGQQSGVILVGHNRPETVKAIVEWRLGNRAQTVALAPVSAALTAQ